MNIFGGISQHTSKFLWWKNKRQIFGDLSTTLNFGPFREVSQGLKHDSLGCQEKYFDNIFEKTLDASLFAMGINLGVFRRILRRFLGRF